VNAVSVRIDTAAIQVLAQRLETRPVAFDEMERSAPRLNASMPTAPAPAYKSTNTAPSKSSPSVENSDALVRCIDGRSPGSSG
jgi:hypothetical protein